MGVVKVNLGNRSYDIVIGAKLEELGDRMGGLRIGKKVVAPVSQV